MKVVIIEWVDACGYGLHWEDREPWSEKPASCITIGLLTHEDEKNVFVVLSLSGDKYSHGEAIPKSCIKRIRKLRVEKTQVKE